MSDTREDFDGGSESDDDFFSSGDGENDGSCFHCAGEGWVECPHPLECTRHHEYGQCRCSSCGGSGLAKDMTIW